MAKQNQPEDKPDPIEVVVTYDFQPYYSVSCDAAKVSGISGFGKTRAEALENLRFQVRRKYPKDQFKIIEKIGASK